MLAQHRHYTYWFSALLVALMGSLHAEQADEGQGKALSTPAERSTKESIQFTPVKDKQLGETTIKGALGPSSGLVGPDTEVLVEPVYLSDESRRSLDLERHQLERQREQLLEAARENAETPPQVQYPGFENRTYAPDSTTNTRVRD